MLGYGREGVCASSFGLNRLKVHEPRPEGRPRQPLQGLRCLPVLLDLVVERAEDASDGALLGEGREGNLDCSEVSHGLRDGWDAYLRPVGQKLVSPLRRSKVQRDELRNGL